MKPLVIDTVTLQPWEYKTSTGIVLRGHETALTGKPIVHFVHGNGFSGLTYLPLLRLLLPHIDLVITNAQGHGGSDVGAVFHGWDKNAAMIHEALLHKLPLWKQQQVPVIGMGHSFGAILTTLIAARHTPVFDRLVLLDPIYLPPAHALLSNLFQRLGLMDRTPMVKATHNRRAHWPDRATARASLHQRGVFRGWDDAALDAYVDHALHERDDGVHLLAPPWLEASVYARYAPGMWRAVRKLPIPCHVIRGEKTFPYVKDGLQRAMRLNPRVTSEVMPGGHCFMQEYPQEAATRVLRALAVQ